MENALYLVKVEPNANNNKYYRLIPKGDYWEAQYGRIGTTGFQTATYPMSQWDKKLNEKLKKGYENKTNLVAETISTSNKKEHADISNPSIAQIVSRLQSMARQAIKDNYTISSNNVTKLMVEEAQILLNNLITIDNLDLFNKVLVDLFKTIPRKMGKVIDYLAKQKENFAEIIQREQDLLDVMKGQVIQHSIIDEPETDNDLPSQTILDVLGIHFEEITQEDVKIIKRQLDTISNKYYQAWKVVNNKTQSKYDEFVKGNKIKNTKLLWHGSRNENFWSIINTGLILRPNAVITGKMFGTGCYFSPDSSKALNYSSLDGSYWSHGKEKSGFMGLFNVAYGKSYDVYSFDSKFYNLNYENLQKMCPNSNSLHAHGGTGMLRKDEIIVYKEDQMTIQYLVELK